MSDRLFVDSNVWIYLFTSDEVSKNTVARQYIADISRENNIMVISFQILNEVGAVLKSKKQFPESKIQFVIETMLDLCVVQNFTKDILLKASSLREEMSIAYWDSIIVATAIDSGCQQLVTEDMQNRQLIDNKLLIVNPFSH